MKTITILPALLLGCLLSGCALAPVEDESVAATSPGDDSSETVAESPQAIDAKIATLDVPGGQVIFVDEGLTEAGGGIAFWEIGNVDLSLLLDVQQATALEVFLALAPEGTRPPARLVEHHQAMVREHRAVSAAPRALTASIALPQHDSFVNDPFGTDDPSNLRNCWGWAGTSSTYNQETGYQSFDEALFQSSFITNYSGISGGAPTSSGVDGITSTNGAPVTTSAGHQRAMAVCVSRATPILNEPGICFGNRVEVTVRVLRSTDSSYTSFVQADSILLTSFGQGARFRSNAINGTNGARKYSMEATFTSPQGEDNVASISCRDEIVVAWRSRWELPLAGG